MPTLAAHPLPPGRYRRTFWFFFRLLEQAGTRCNWPAPAELAYALSAGPEPAEVELLRSRPIVAILIALSCLLSVNALASSPTTVQVEGQLRAASGAPVVDGSYLATFRLYAAPSGGAALWTEQNTKLSVMGGHFRHALGAAVSLKSAFVTGKARWLGIQVANEPEMGRTALHAAPFASRSAAADSLNCTGCLSLAALNIDGDLDLGKGVIKSKGVSAANLLAGDVVAQQLIGDGSKLSGVVPPKGDCPNGQVVNGVKADGELSCTPAGGVGGGSLEQASGGQLTTNWAETFPAGGLPKGIDDNNPVGTVAEITLPDVGVVASLVVSLHLTNSDVSSLQVMLYAPTNEMFLLHKGGAAGKTLKTSWPTPTKPVSGDLSKWIGANPKGKWRLRVIDNKFLNNGVDGQILAFSVAVQGKSTKQVTALGAFATTGGFIAPKPPVKPTCSGKQLGEMYFSPIDKRMHYCDGSDRRILIEPLCGNGKINPGEGCDDGNVADGDGCTAKCLVNVCGDNVLWKGKEQCDDGNIISGDGCSKVCVNEIKPLTKIVVSALNNAHQGNMGGIKGADALCNKEAKASNFKQTWKAFLSTSKVPVKDMFKGNEATGLKVYNSKNQLLSNSWTTLMNSGNGNLSASIYAFKGHKVDEGQGANPDWSDADGWTGSDKSGNTKAGRTCNDWTSNNGCNVRGFATEVDANQMLREEDHCCQEWLAVMCVTINDGMGG